MESLARADVELCLNRHLRCDWGNICDRDWEENDRALLTRDRLFSTYRAGNGRRFWVITDAGWSRTTVLMPDEY